MPRQGPPADRGHRRTDDLTANIKGSDPFTFGAPLVKGRPDPALGVFETLRGRGEPGSPPRAAAALGARAVRRGAAARSRCRDCDGAVRITYVPGQPRRRSTTREYTPRPLPIVLTPVTSARRAGRAQVATAADRAPAGRTTPLLLDADGTMLEAAWASVLIERDGVLYTPREDGRILPEHLAARGDPGRPAAAARRPAVRQLVAGGSRAGRARGNQPGTARR